MHVPNLMSVSCFVLTMSSVTAIINNYMQLSVFFARWEILRAFAVSVFSIWYFQCPVCNSE